ncbi:MAG: ATP-binding cassette domain-containing protein, partial [Prevotella sp.]|nr:ATP-binding cassette domain-containing protein [Prevotella sp.]
GGESQRVNLTTILGSPLVGTLYVLDEPSIGLHSRDTHRLIDTLKQLRDLGNTVVVVEHDEDILHAADQMIEIGPDAGALGGRIIPEGEGYTAKYLDGTLSIPVPTSRRAYSHSITFEHLNAHNLRDLTVRLPLGVMTVITGVSGSGKSTLVKEIIKMFPALPLQGRVGGGLIIVDQSPVGKSTRSNPATYMKAWDAIRQLFAQQPLAKQLDITAAHFSFNTDGGRCEECQGAGTITIEMQFMADLTMPCEACHGKRFKPQILEVRYQGKNVDDILNMTVDEAIEFFSSERAITALLLPLQQVGLGYITLGQPTATLSGGENQRLKLAYYLAKENHEPSLFIFDEPTTGLHFHDIRHLLAAFDRLLSRGHTILVVEHNMDIIKCADHIIDLGPEAGAGGGTIVAEGTPEEVAECQESHTAKFLKEKLA